MTRKSKKRDAIYSELCSTTSHPSAETIYMKLKESFPDLSLGTVYTNLSTFKREGLAISVGIVNGRERFDGNTTPHVHFVCKCCGDVIDLWNVSLPAVPDFDGTIDEYQLNYYGKCSKCNENRSIESERMII